MSDAVIIALIAVVPSLIAAVTTIVTTLLANGEKKKKELDKQIDKINQEVGKKVDDIGRKVDGVKDQVDSVRTMVDNTKKQLKKSIDEVDGRLQQHIESDDNSTRVLLRHNIDWMYDKFMPRGYITHKESEEIKETYEAYQAIGGNHIGEEKYKELMALPRKD